MPKYYNNTSASIVVDGIDLPSRQTTVSEKWIKSALPTGVTKISDAPYYNFLAADELFTSDDEIEITKAFQAAQMMTVKIKAISGNVVIFLDDESNLPGYSVLQGFEESFQMNPWNISKLLVRFVAPASSDLAQIKIFKR